MLAFVNHLSSLSLFLFMILHNHGHLARGHSFIYAGCSQDKYQPNSAYETNVNSLLSSIFTSSSHTLYNIFALGNDTTAPPESTAYGLYQCRGDLEPRDCYTCVANAINQIEFLCPYTCGASLQLDACFVRYENTNFLGKLDTSLRYKKCSAGSGGNDAEFLRRRDDVLAELQGATGFRVSAAGAVEGYAQCLGDLMAADCSACLSDGVTKVKSVCGSAVAGYVSLAQCYVRYWESGYYGAASDSHSQDDVGKTVAIAVGVVAGVGVLVVLLSFCRKSLG